MRVVAFVSWADGRWRLAWKGNPKTWRVGEWKLDSGNANMSTGDLRYWRVGPIELDRWTPAPPRALD